MRHALLVLAFLAAVQVAAPGAQAPALDVAPMKARIIPPMVEKTRVYVEHTGSDAAGRAFVAGLKDGLRASKRFALADSDDSAAIVMVIVSVSPAPTTRVASAVSLAYVVNNEHRSLLASAARFVGRDRAQAMGRDTVNELTAIVTAYEPHGEQ